MKSNVRGVAAVTSQGFVISAGRTCNVDACKQNCKHESEASLVFRLLCFKAYRSRALLIQSSESYLQYNKQNMI